jgi:predicted ATPase
VGRRTEQERFGTALLAAEPPFVVLYLHGPSGVGETTLLDTYARLAAARCRPVVYLDAHHIAPTPPTMLHALQQQVGQAVGDLPTLVRAWPSNGVLLLDTYETLAPLDS